MTSSRDSNMVLRHAGNAAGWNRHLVKEKSACLSLKNTETGAFFHELMGMLFLLFLAATVWQLVTVYLSGFHLELSFWYAVACPRHILVRVWGEVCKTPLVLCRVSVFLIRWCAQSLYRLPTPSILMLPEQGCIQPHMSCWMDIQTPQTV